MLIELFHLLPPPLVKLLDPLVKVTMQLEADNPRTRQQLTLDSPFRLPLVKFLNLQAKASVEYFLNPQRVSDPIFRPLFRFILKCPEAGAH